MYCRACLFLIIKLLVHITELLNSQSMKTHCILYRKVLCVALNNGILL
jgi:hypothetical protein